MKDLIEEAVALALEVPEQAPVMEVPEGMTMNFLTVYNPATGEILETHQSPGEIQLADRTKVFVSAEGNIRTQYVLEGEVVDRPTFAAELDGDFLRGVPNGATVTIDGTEYTADGSVIELSFTLKATHYITVSMWPYLPMELVHEDQS